MVLTESVKRARPQNKVNIRVQVHEFEQSQKNSAARMQEVVQKHEGQFNIATMFLIQFESDQNLSAESVGYRATAYRKNTGTKERVQESAQVEFAAVTVHTIS